MKGQPVRESVPLVLPSWEKHGSLLSSNQSVSVFSPLLLPSSSSVCPGGLRDITIIIEDPVAGLGARMSPSLVIIALHSGFPSTH